MDILDNYFGEALQKYKQQIEYGKVYSDPAAFAFQSVDNNTVSELKEEQPVVDVETEHATDNV